jgi:hypothetical protein
MSAGARVIACRAESGHQVWLRFDDGLEGRFSLGYLLELGAFRELKDVRKFRDLGVIDGRICWPAVPAIGSLHPEVLWHEVAKNGTGCRPPPPAADPMFQRFMLAALTPAKGKRRSR